jgi:hypothetical protein
MPDGLDQTAKMPILRAALGSDAGAAEMTLRADR